MANNRIPLAIGFNPANNVASGLEEFLLPASSIDGSGITNGYVLTARDGDVDWEAGGGSPEVVYFEVKNDSGAEITAGQVVFASGEIGDNVLVGLAKADSTATMPAIGIAHISIPNGTTGLITSFGEVRDGTYENPSPGATLYVSPTTAGQATTTKPTALNHLIQNVGFVVRSSGTQIIKVNITGRANDVPNTTYQDQGNPLATTTGVGLLSELVAYTLPASALTVGKLLNIYITGQIVQATGSDQNINFGFDLGPAGTPTTFSSAASWTTSTDPSYFTVKATIQPLAAGTQHITQEFTSTDRTVNNGSGSYNSSNGISGISRSNLTLDLTTDNTISFAASFGTNNTNSQIAVYTFKVEII